MLALVIGLLFATPTGAGAQSPPRSTPGGSIPSSRLGGSAFALVRSNSWSAQQFVDRVARERWNTFSARIVLRRAMLAADGAPVGVPPITTEYTWERSKTAAGWKTTMTLVAASEVTVQTRTGLVTLPEMPTVAKMEDSGDGSAPRFWALNGVEIKIPSRSTQMAVMGADAAAGGASMAEDILHGVSGVIAPSSGGATAWIDAFIMPAATRKQRLSAFDRQFGPSRGTVRGLSRRVRQQGDREREVLVDEQDGVPIESNLMVQGELVSHTTFGYERAASGTLLRRGVRTEQVLFRGDGRRAVTELSFSDIAVEQRGGR
jgi:hypothetical protein